jgi:hypothetical protein
MKSDQLGCSGLMGCTCDDGYFAKEPVACIRAHDLKARLTDFRDR